MWVLYLYILLQNCSMKRTSIEIKKVILEVLNDNIEHSYVDLERKVNTNWQSIRNQCRELELFEAIEIKDKKIRITAKGKYFLNKFR